MELFKNNLFFIKKIKWKTIQSKLVLFLSIFIASCASNNKNEPETETTVQLETTLSLTDAQLKKSNVEIGKMEEKNISSTLKVNGIIDVPPQNMISISMPLGGYLKSTKLLPGMHINQGEIIATLEDQQYIQIQQDYLATQVKLVFAEKEYQRQKELNTSKASSDKIFQMAEMEYKTLKIALSAMGEKLKLIHINPKNLTETNLTKSANIYSPINGYVSKVNVNIGKYVTPSDVLFELVNPSDIHLNLNIFEKDLSKLAIGQKLVAYTNSQENIKYPCSIILISKNFTANHSAEVHCHFDKYNNTLIPGMYMNAEIEIRNTLVYSLPEKAVVNFEGKNYIFIAKNNQTFELTEVELGQKENGFIEIMNSDKLKENNIVINGAYTLLMAMKNKAEE